MQKDFIHKKNKQSTARPRGVLTFLLHLTIVSILFMLPEVIMIISHKGEIPGLMSLTRPMVWIFVFYAGFYFTCDPTDGRRRTLAKFVVENLMVVLAALAILQLLIHFGPEPRHRPHGPRMGETESRTAFNLAMLTRDVVMIILTLALSLTLKLISRFMHIEHARRDYEVREREAELNSLRGQLNPHFLFNTLNGIYALIDIAPERAQKAIHELSRMLRYMLYENPRSVTLSAELEFVEHYVALMSLRLPPSVGLKTSISGGDCMNNEVMPMLFINIIENVFKYGSRCREAGPVEIDISVTDGVLVCRTSNGYDRNAESEGGGIGLTNLRRRLEIQYQGRHSLKISRGERFTVEMHIDISRPPAFPAEDLTSIEPTESETLKPNTDGENKMLCYRR